MIRWLLSWFGIGRVVYLIDCDGEVYRSIAREDAFGQIWCPVYPTFNVGHVILDENGMTRGRSSYIKRWKDA